MDEKRSKRIKAALERYGMLSPDSVGIHQGDTTRLICRLNDPDRATRSWHGCQRWAALASASERLPISHQFVPLGPLRAVKRPWESAFNAEFDQAFYAV